MQKQKQKKRKFQNIFNNSCLSIKETIIFWNLFLKHTKINTFCPALSASMLLSYFRGILFPDPDPDPKALRMIQVVPI